MKKRETVLAVVTVVVVITALLYSTVLAPQLRQYQLQKQFRQQLEMKFYKLKRDYQIKDQINAAYTRIEPLIRTSGTDQQEISRFSRQLHQLYAPLPIAIKAVKILPIVRETYHRKVQIKIELAGKIPDIKQFIADLLASNDPLRIEQFNLQAQEVVDALRADFVISKVIAAEKQS